MEDCSDEEKDVILVEVSLGDKSNVNDQEGLLLGCLLLG